MPKKRAPCETDNANKVSGFLNTSDDQPSLPQKMDAKHKTPTFRTIQQMPVDENAENGQFPFTSDLKQSKTI